MLRLTLVEPKCMLASFLCFPELKVSEATFYLKELTIGSQINYIKLVGMKCIGRDEVH